MIIDFNRYNGGGGSGSGVTPQEVQAQIDSALTPYWESGETKDYVDGAVSGISLDGYYTSGETDEAIAQAVSGLATEQYVQDALSGVSLEGYWNSAETEEAISTATADFVNSGDVKTVIGNYTYLLPDSDQGVLRFFRYYQNGSSTQHILGNPSINGEKMIDTSTGKNFVLPTSADVKTQIEGYNYVTSGEVETQITNKNYITDQALTAYTPTSGFATVNGSAITNGGNIVIQGGGGGDMSNYWNSAQTKSYVDSAATNLQDQIDTMDEVVSDALNDLNGDLANKVSSSSVSTIWKGTQAQYDAIVTKDPATFYIIVSSN